MTSDSSEDLGTLSSKQGKCKSVFVYGSLLNKKEAFKVVSKHSWNLVVPALLNGYRRVYNKWSIVRLGCVLNIETYETGSVLGLLLGGLSRSEVSAIGKRELWGKHYDCIVVEVEKLSDDRKTVQALTSIAKKPFVRGKTVSKAYEKIVEAGLEDLSARFQMPDFVKNYHENTYGPNGKRMGSH